MKIILLKIIMFGIIFLINPQPLLAANEPALSEAIIVNVAENSWVIESSGNKHPYQKLEVLGTSGIYKGKQVLIENGKYDQSGIIEYKRGDKVILSITKMPSGPDRVVISDYSRTTPLYVLFAIFVGLAILVGGIRGATSLLGMILTFFLLFFFVLPQIALGVEPLFITVLSTLVIVPVTFFLSHGINKKTISAIAGTFISLILAGLLSMAFVSLTHLSGYSSEEANFLSVAKGTTINMHSLLLAGIIIGLLGILQDITVSQAAIIFQLKRANEKLGFLALFLKAMDVGRDHIASMINTLVLVYAGASLPLLLLFTISGQPFISVLNFEVIAEEIVRTLSASVGLILAVPITTAISALFAVFSSHSITPSKLKKQLYS